MVFRKYAVNYRIMQILTVVCAVGAVLVLVGLFPVSREDMPVCILFLAVAGSMLLLCVCSPWNEKICIGEDGLCCTRGKHILWTLRWDEIACIRAVPVYRCRGYVIVPRSTPVIDLHKPAGTPSFEIQHTSALRDALLSFGAHLQ